MNARNTNGTSQKTLYTIIIAASILWAIIRPDLWVWAFCFALMTIPLLSIAYNAGIKHGREYNISEELELEATKKPEHETEAETQLKAYDTALAEVELFYYELERGLVPDGNTDDNPGYGPMSFKEWQEWKKQEFEKTGNLWHNHPNGLPPKAKAEIE